MALQAVHDSLDDIPEQFQELYTEKNGKFELTGIAGVKTQGDIDRLQTSLHKAQQDNKDLKAKFSVWGDLDHEDVMAKLDRMPELEAAAAGKLDDAAIEEIVNKRVEGTINSRTAPLERRIKELEATNGELTEANGKFVAADRTRNIHDAVREQLTKQKVIPEAHDDALMLADRVFEIREDDGAIVTKDQVGVTPGVTPEVWLNEMQERRPHWWPGSVGGGAGGGKGGGPTGFSNNPWSHENWNMTKQGEVLRTQGREKADAMAKAAGTTVGGQRPAAKK